MSEPTKKCIHSAGAKALIAKINKLVSDAYDKGEIDSVTLGTVLGAKHKKPVVHQVIIAGGIIWGD